MSKFIKQLKIKNFRAYYDATFEFEINKNKKLNVIFGTNDDGKTTFLNSLRYVLYGEDEVSDSKNIENKKSICNINHLDEKTNVTLKLTDESNNKVTSINRTEDELKVYVDQNYKEVGITEVNKLLPMAVKDLFIFEGEKSKNQITNSLKNTIEEVSGLRNLLIAKELLSILQTKGLSELKKLNTKNDEKNHLIDAIQKHSLEMEKIKKQIIIYESKREGYVKELGEVKERLRNNNERVVSELQKRKEAGETLRKVLENNLSEKRKDIMTLYVKDISDWTTYDCIKPYEDMLKDLSKKGLLPTAFATEDIKKLIKRSKDEKCICGNCIGKKEITELKKIIEKNKKAPKNSEQLPILKTLTNLEKEDFKTLNNKLSKELKELVKIESQLTECQNEIDTANKSLDDLKGEDVEKDVAKQADLDSQISLLNSDIVLEEDNFNKEDSLKKRLENESLSYPPINKKEEEIQATLRKIGNYIEKIDKIYKLFTEKMKEEILSKIKEIFKKIFSKTEKANYYEFDFGENFELEVKSPEGRIMPIYSLGTGVKKTMGIATALILSKIYGFEFPMILDAPFTELDRPQKKELLEVLIKVSKKQQIIMLILKEDQEDKEIFKILKNNSSTLNKISNIKNKNIKVEKVK